MEKGKEAVSKHLWELDDLAKAQELARWYLEKVIMGGGAKPAGAAAKH